LEEQWVNFWPFLFETPRLILTKRNISILFTYDLQIAMKTRRYLIKQE
jgi:hypothetical protein